MVGIEGYTPLNETAAYMNLNDAQAITNNTGNVTDFKVFADNVTTVEDVASKISIMYPKLSVSIAASLVDSVIQMQTQTNEELQMAQASMSQIQSTGTMEIAYCHLGSCGNRDVHNVVHGSGANPRNWNFESVGCQ